MATAFLSRDLKKRGCLKSRHEEIQTDKLKALADFTPPNLLPPFSAMLRRSEEIKHEDTKTQGGEEVTVAVGFGLLKEVEVLNC